MHNPALPKLLRAIAEGADAKAKKHDVIFNAAADVIEQLSEEIAALRVQDWDALKSSRQRR